MNRFDDLPFLQPRRNEGESSSIRKWEAMSAKLREGFAAMAGFALLGGLGYACWLVITSTFHTLSSLNSQIAVAIIAAAGAALVSVVSIVLGKAYESRSAIAKEHREKKIPVYESLIKFMFRILMGAKTGASVKEEEMVDFMANFTQQLTVWGSDDVLVAWGRFRTVSQEGAIKEKEPAKLMTAYEDLLRAIRRDLGHKNTGLKRGDILSLFINDAARYFPR